MTLLGILLFFYNYLIKKRYLNVIKILFLKTIFHRYYISNHISWIFFQHLTFLYTRNSVNIKIVIIILNFKNVYTIHSYNAYMHVYSFQKCYIEVAEMEMRNHYSEFSWRMVAKLRAFIHCIMSSLVSAAK